MRKIAILCTGTVPWVARFQDGFRSYAQKHAEWHIFGFPPPLFGSGESVLTLRSLSGWKGDGIIISSNDINELRYAKSIDIPVLNLGGGLPSNHGIPRIMLDHYAAGRMAAEHMIDRGLSNLAFFGWKNQWYSQERCHGFQDYAAESGASCKILLRPTEEDAALTWSDRIAILTEWLSSLPLPCGIFAVQDYRAQLLIEACHEAGLKVPSDIAVIGMDNDETICEHSIPKLSSMTRNAFLLGYEAASVLDLMMQGQSIPSKEILIAPSEIVIRESSDMMYSSDPLVSEAIKYMREHLRKSFNIIEVADHVGVSKRTLETRFSKSIKRSPHQCLTKLRVYKAQKLIKQNPKKTFETLSAECGFGTSMTFYTAFQRITGETPASFRSKATNSASTTSPKD